MAVRFKTFCEIILYTYDHRRKARPTYRCGRIQGAAAASPAVGATAIPSGAALPLRFSNDAAANLFRGNAAGAIGSSGTAALAVISGNCRSRPSRSRSTRCRRACASAS